LVDDLRTLLRKEGPRLRLLPAGISADLLGGREAHFRRAINNKCGIWGRGIERFV